MADVYRVGREVVAVLGAGQVLAQPIKQAAVATTPHWRRIAAGGVM